MSQEYEDFEARLDEAIAAAREFLVGGDDTEGFLDAARVHVLRRWRHNWTDAADRRVYESLSWLPCAIAKAAQSPDPVKEFKAIVASLVAPNTRQERYSRSYVWLFEAARHFMALGDLEATLRQMADLRGETYAAARRRFFRLAAEVRQAIPHTQMERLATELGPDDGIIACGVAITGALARMLISISR
ncbi:MAG: hypothetical protein KatS3mg022_3415 [Armatimonadota bacterium]|nr:MAG: hypothetical protein KatS3mg022_1455 [Armatimonadota bacterium]GIV17980.1 MAG: hypothetical protein KatS3mg022_3415 [Armatimonadota bacterium]